MKYKFLLFATTLDGVIGIRWLWIRGVHINSSIFEKVNMYATDSTVTCKWDLVTSKIIVVLASRFK